MQRANPGALACFEESVQSASRAGGRPVLSPSDLADRRINSVARCRWPVMPFMVCRAASRFRCVEGNALVKRQLLRSKDACIGWDTTFSLMRLVETMAAELTWETAYQTKTPGAWSAVVHQGPGGMKLKGLNIRFRMIPSRSVMPSILIRTGNNPVRRFKGSLRHARYCQWRPAEQ